MTLETLAATGAKGANDAHEPFSAAWWEQRTAAELREIIKRGFAVGEAFRGAVSETERRAREETRRLREVAAAEAERRRKRKRVIAGTLAAVTVAAGAAIWVS